MKSGERGACEQEGDGGEGGGVEDGGWSVFQDVF